jgi:hypothetical protein
MTPAGSGGGGRLSRGAPVKVEKLKRRQLARPKGYDKQAYDGCGQAEGEES